MYRIQAAALFLLLAPSARGADRKWARSDAPLGVVLMPAVSAEGDRGRFQDIHLPLYQTGLQDVELSLRRTGAEDQELRTAHRLQSAVEGLAAEGPLMAVRDGNRLAILPRSLEPGSGAAILTLKANRTATIGRLTPELSRTLAQRVGDWDFGSVFGELERAFDGTEAAEGSFPASRSPAPAGRPSLAPALVMPVRTARDLARFGEIHLPLFQSGAIGKDSREGEYQAETAILSRIWGVAHEMLAQGAVMGVRRGDQLALLPKSLHAGAKAALFALPSSVPGLSTGLRDARVLELTEKTAGSLRGALARLDIGSAPRILQEAWGPAPAKPKPQGARRFEDSFQVLRMLNEQLAERLHASQPWRQPAVGVQDLEMLLEFCEREAFANVTPGFTSLPKADRWRVWERWFREAWGNAPALLKDKRGYAMPPAIQMWPAIGAGIIDGELGKVFLAEVEALVDAHDMLDGRSQDSPAI